jgi:hypothetical protein
MEEHVDQNDGPWGKCVLLDREESSRPRREATAFYWYAS